jgi:phage terminase large subunit-like protein
MTIPGLSEETYYRAKLADLKAKQARRKRAELKDPVSWIQKHFFIPELSGPIQLMPYQAAVLRESQRVDANGDFVYSVVVWSDIKKSAKSSIAAAMALYIAQKNQWAEIKIIANDLKQADSRVAKFFRRAMELNSEFVDGRTYKQRGYTTTFLDNNSEVEAIPIDPGGEAGSNADLLIFSELWAAKHKAIKQMWSELTLSPLKFGKSQRWVETYAGHTGEAPILEQLYHRGVKEGRKLDLSFSGHDFRDLEVYANGSLLCLWNDRPRCPWQTPAYYQSEAATLLESEFDRMHRNQWVSSMDTFVPLEWWSACQAPIPGLSNNQPMVLAVDASVTDDSFGLVGVTRYRVGELDGVDVRYVRQWIPPKGGKIDFQGTPENPGPEREIRRLCEQYNVVMVAYDPYQLEDMAGRLSREGVAWMYAFGQGAPRLRADSDLRTIIRDKRIRHSGEPELAEHIMNSGAKTDGEDSRIRIVKKAQHLKVDLTVSLSMCSHECMRLNL